MKTNYIPLDSAFYAKLEKPSVADILGRISQQDHCSLGIVVKNVLATADNLKVKLGARGYADEEHALAMEDQLRNSQDVFRPDQGPFQAIFVQGSLLYDMTIETSLSIEEVAETLEACAREMHVTRAWLEQQQEIGEALEVR